MPIPRQHDQDVRSLPVESKQAEVVDRPEQVRHHGQAKRRRRRIATLVAVSLLTATVGVGLTDAAFPAQAEASTLRCGWPRCTLWLNRGETHNYAFNGVMPPTTVYSLLYVFMQLSLKEMAKSYYRQGLCVGFQASAVPWETQSLFPYRC